MDAVGIEPTTFHKYVSDDAKRNCRYISRNRDGEVWYTYIIPLDQAPERDGGSSVLAQLKLC
jgi:hypothetical protein